MKLTAVTRSLCSVHQAPGCHALQPAFKRGFPPKPVDRIWPGKAPAIPGNTVVGRSPRWQVGTLSESLQEEGYTVEYSLITREIPRTQAIFHHISRLKSQYRQSKFLKIILPVLYSRGRQYWKSCFSVLL